MLRRRPPSPPDAPFRRALAETLADARFEVQAARSVWGRSARVLTGLLAVLRLVMSVGGVFDEGYPMRNLSRDLRYALRRLAAAPVFTVFSVITLGLGLGATTAFVSLIHAATGPPRAVRDPATVLNVYHAMGLGDMPALMMSWPDYADFKTAQTSFDRVMAWMPFGSATLTAHGQTETASGEIVDGDYFAVLGVQPALGRALTPEDCAHRASVAVISDRTWQMLFDGAPNVLGQSVIVDGHPFTVVGIAPAAFSGVFNGGLVQTAVWLPVSAGLPFGAFGRPTLSHLDDRDDREFLVKGRLKAGRTLAEAQAELTVIARTLDHTFPLGARLDPEMRRRARALSTRPWTLERVSDVVITEGQAFVLRPLARALLGAVGLVLLVACSNLANLSLARGSGRRMDLAVRRALGASRWRLMREALVEAGLVVLVGTALGALVARLLLWGLTRDVAVGVVVIRFTPSFDLSVWLAALAAVLVAFAVTGLVPAWQSTRADLRSVLANDSVGTAASPWRGRQWLISLQVTVSLALLAVATIAADSFVADLRHDPGIALNRLAVAKIDFSQSGQDEGYARTVIDQVTTSLARQAGVEGVAVSSGLPLGSLFVQGRVSTVDRPLDPVKPGGRVMALLATTPSVFPTWGVSVRTGRAFTERDGPTAAPVAMVSETAAEVLFATTDVVGRAVQVQDRPQADNKPAPITTRTIVGVAHDTDVLAVGLRSYGLVYVPLAQHYEPEAVFTIRTSRTPDSILPTIRQAITSVDPQLVVAPLRSAVEVTGGTDPFLQATMGIAGALGLFALALALVGLYGALSHVVGCRTREMGIRLSLGANASELVRLVIYEGVQPVIMGLIIGLLLGGVGAFALQPLFRRGLSVANPLIFAVAPILILAAGVLASYLPARRAGRVDPNVALRAL